MLKSIDKHIGSLLVKTLPPLLTSTKPIKNPKNVVIIKMSGMGDSVLTLPLIKNLDLAGLEVNVFAWNTRAATIYEHCPLVKKVLRTKDLTTSLHAYDVAIDCELFSNFSALIACWLGKQTIGFAGKQRANCYTTKIRFEENQHYAKNVLSLGKAFIDGEVMAYAPLNFVDHIGKKMKNYAVFHISTEHSAPQRRWKHFRELAELCHKRYGLDIVLTGKGKDRKVIEEQFPHPPHYIIDLCDKLTFDDLLSVLKHARFVVSNDTGPMHLAAALGTPTIGLFGPNTPKRFGALGKRVINIYKAEKLNCSPCINVREGQFPTCTNPLCMEKIKVEDVVKAIDKVVNN